MPSKSPAQAAYEKWRERLGDVAARVCEVPPWSGCLPNTRRDWEQIADAAIGGYLKLLAEDAHHAMVDELNRTEGGTA